MPGCSDGMWGNVQYFACPPGKGFFCPFSILKEVKDLKNRKL